MANNNLPLLKYLTPFLLNGVSLLIMYLYGNHTKTNQYAAAVNIIILILAVFVLNIIFLFVFLKSKEYLVSVIHLAAACGIIIFLINLK